MKRLQKLKLILLASIVVIGVLIILLSSIKQKDVFISDLQVSEDGTFITLKTGVASSAGFTRSVSISKSNDSVYLTFYPTFGINSRLGAKNTFTFDVTKEINKIYIYRGDKDTPYQLVFEKISDNQWERIKSN